jgi:hypothetical protein
MLVGGFQCWPTVFKGSQDHFYRVYELIKNIKKIILNYIRATFLDQNIVLTHGLLKQMSTLFLCRKCDVINRGFSGYNTRWNRIVLPQILHPHDWQHVVGFVIFLGANDSVLPDLNPSQHVPIEEYKENLIAMVQSLQVGTLTKL